MYPLNSIRLRPVWHLVLRPSNVVNVMVITEREHGLLANSRTLEMAKLLSFSFQPFTYSCDGGSIGSKGSENIDKFEKISYLLYSPWLSQRIKFSAFPPISAL